MILLFTGGFSFDPNQEGFEEILKQKMAEMEKKTTENVSSVIDEKIKPVADILKTFGETLSQMRIENQAKQYIPKERQGQLSNILNEAENQWFSIPEEERKSINIDKKLPELIQKSVENIENEEKGIANSYLQRNIGMTYDDILNLRPTDVSTPDKKLEAAKGDVILERGIKEFKKIAENAVGIKWKDINWEKLEEHDIDKNNYKDMSVENFVKSLDK